MAGCASMAPPGGGPEDKQPPVIMDVSPASEATGVDPKQPVIFTFSETVDRESILEALFISPPQTKQPKIKVRGRAVKLILADSIPNDRTTVVSLGTGVKDLHGNSLEQSYTVAFTAGDRIDRGSITGSVFADDPIQSMLVGAWRVHDSLVVNPVEKPPEFLTQTGRDGRYRFDFIPAGVYRIACWDDKDRDRLYEPGVDRLGLPSRDVELADSSEAWLELYPVRRDTSIVRLYLVSAPDNRHVVMRFNLAINRHPDRILPELSIYDSSGVLTIQRAWIDAGDSSRLVLFTVPQKAGGEYLVSISGDTSTYTFSTSAVLDSIGPRVIASSPADGDRDQSRPPKGWIGFSDGLAPTDFQSLLTLYNSGNWNPSDSLELPDSLKYDLTWRQDEPNMVAWEAVSEVPFGAQLTLSVDLVSVRDMPGNASPDSIWSMTFNLIDPAETGTILGSVEGPVARSIVVAKPLKKTAGGEKRVLAQPDRTFVVDMLRAGEYQIWAFDDLNHSGAYDFGQLDPFKFAEHFAANSDTINVRARWETAGVKIVFK